MLLFLKLHTIRSIGGFLVNSVCLVPKPIKQIQCGFKNLRITWKTLPAAVVTVTQFAAKVFMLMKHAKLKKKKSLHSDKFYVITTLYVYK